MDTDSSLRANAAADPAGVCFAFAALSQPVRLQVFRLLVRAEPDGLAAGEIADALDIRQNTMSANLAVLLRAGLVTNARSGRSIRYRADLAAMGRLIQFLLTNCCGGSPERCAPVINSLLSPTACEC
jgi:ArsR family transcriptional regulator, arsenate/arsenite/antimonite-responsive transcriptional repressor